METSGVRALLPDHDVRPVEMTDVPILVDLVARMTTEVLGEPDANEAEIRDDLTGSHFILEADTFIAVAPDGRAVAYGQGHDEHTGSGWVDVYVDLGLPESLFDQVADAAIDACAGRIDESATKRGAPSVTLSADLYEPESRMRSAYERAGFRLETVYWRMCLDLTEHPPEQPALPGGFSIRSVDPDDDDVMRQAFDLHEETFSEHHGFEDTDRTLDDYSNDWRSAESYDPKAWWFAYEADTPVGMLLGDNRRSDQGAGYVRALGVKKRLRGRGLARALLLTSFAHYRDQGCASVQLGVDTGNVTGATRLYESVGMRSIHSAIALARHDVLPV